MARGDIQGLSGRVNGGGLIGHEGPPPKMHVQPRDKPMAEEHPGFKSVQKDIASKMGGDMKRAGRILAAKTRKASPAAKKANPRLKRVK